MFQIGIAVLVNLLTVSWTADVTFLPDVSFNMPNSFDDGKLPCSKQTVVFPNTLLNSIKLESDISVNGLILPTDGELDLIEASIMLGEDQAEYNCSNNEVVNYIDRSTSKWNQADVWSSSRYNKATPDSEKMPCYDDVVIFPSDAQFTLVLPDSEQIVREIIVKNQSLDTEAFKSVAINTHNDDAVPQMFINNNYYGSGVAVSQYEQCFSKAGCPCQKHPLEPDCLTKFCSVPKCAYPVKPNGHCCKICGGFIYFDIDESFDMKAFKELVVKVVDSYGNDELVYHIGRTQNVAQLVVTDLHEYDGKSAEVVMDINHGMESHWVQEVKLVKISGSPLSKTGLGIKLFFSMFFVVVLVLGLIYVYYYKLSDVRYPILDQIRSRGMLSRFQRRTDSVVSLTRRDSGVGVESTARRSFRNPLYDSKRGRVQVTESILEE